MRTLGTHPNHHSIPADKYVARMLDASDPQDRSAFQYLRYSYFVAIRGWVEGHPTKSRCDSDRYDGSCYHFGVFDGEDLAGYFRALPWQPDIGFMLEHEFRCLLSDAQFQSLDRATGLDISRLVITPELRGVHCLHVTDLLFKLLYQFCLENGVSHLYAVLEAGWLRRFRNCFHLPFQALGPSVKFPDGTRTVAAHASLRELERHLSAVNPDKLRWYQDLDGRAIP